MRVQLPYHGFNNLAEFLNGDLALKIGQGILSCVLMDRKFNCSIPYNINGKWVYEGKCRDFVIYELKFSMSGYIYIGNTQYKFKNKIDGHFSYLLCLLKNDQKIKIICCPLRTEIWCYCVTYRPTQVHDVQSVKSDQPYWWNEIIHET